MKKIIPVASGKGGVGKTLLTANLGAALAASGKTVILVDLDLGGANLHTCLGIRNSNAGIGSLIKGQTNSLADLVIPTDFSQLFFIPGDGMLPGIANIPYFQKMKILKNLEKLTADYIILDLGAGTSFNTLDFFLSSPLGILVILPEITSVLNAYSFLKNAYIRSIYRSFPPESSQREYLDKYTTQRIEGGIAVPEMLNEIISLFPDADQKMKAITHFFNIKIIMNRCKEKNETEMGRRLIALAQKNLGLQPEFTAVLPHDDKVPASLFSRKPYVLTDPDCHYSTIIRQMAQNLETGSYQSVLPLYPSE